MVFGDEKMINEERNKWNYLPGLSIFGAVISVLVFIISALSWGGIPPKNLSQLVFGWGFGLFILFISYYYWMKRLDDLGKQEMKQDIQAIDNKCNDIENKLIEINTKQTQ